MKSSLRLRMLAGTSLAGILILGLLGLSVYLAMRQRLSATLMIRCASKRTSLLA